MLRTRRRGEWETARVVLAAVVIAALASCSPARVNVTAQKMRPIATDEIRRIAVLPFTSAGLEMPPPQPGEEPLAAPPAELVTRAMGEALRRYATFQIVDPSVTADAFSRISGQFRAPTTEEGVAVGKRLGVDAVLRGEVTEFRERVGTEAAAKDPASVAFNVELIRIPTGEPVWKAQYAETQRALAENLWNVAGWFRAGAKWVRASELAELGAENIAAALYEALTGKSGLPRRGR